MPVTKIKLEKFTAFEDLEVEFSPGINALVGANGTGKTHLMKACYAACDTAQTPENFALKVVNVFLPTGRPRGRLVHRGSATETQVGKLQVFTDVSSLRAGFAADGGVIWSDKTDQRFAPPIHAAYIPAKDMLANAPGFQSLYETREIHFEEVYRDILLRAYLPVLRQPVDHVHERMQDKLEEKLGGKVVIVGEEFFLRDERGDTVFSLVAEGFRKLGLLWLLIRNGTLRDGSVLFWDEPEANLNPKMFRVVIEVLLELQRAGVQVFFATHDYVILKELDLQMTEEDAVAFHSLYRDEEGEIACHTTSRYLEISPNAIDEAFDDLYDREIERSLGGLNR